MMQQLCSLMLKPPPSKNARSVRYASALKMTLSDIRKLMTLVTSSHKGSIVAIKPWIDDFVSHLIADDQNETSSIIITVMHRSFFPMAPPLDVLAVNISKATKQAMKKFDEPEKRELELKAAIYSVPAVGEILKKSFEIPKKYSSTCQGVDDMIVDFDHVCKVLKFNKSQVSALKKSGIKNFSHILEKFSRRRKSGLSEVPDPVKECLYSVTLWFYTFAAHDDNGCPPNIRDTFTEESWNSWTEENNDKIVIGKTLREFSENDAFQVSNIDSVNYMNQIRKVVLPPVLLTLFINTGMYVRKGEKITGQAENYHVCHWSQPRVNNRTPELSDCNKIRKSLFEIKAPMDFTEDYAFLPYIVHHSFDEQDVKHGEVIRCVVDKEDKLSGNPIALSLEKNLAETEKLFRFVCGRSYDEMYPSEAISDGMSKTKFDVLIKPYLVFVKSLVHLAQKYGNFANVKLLKKLRDDLLEYITENRPEYWLTEHDESYADIFIRAKLLLQAAFKIRLATLEGGHRILSMISGILNLVVNEDRSSEPLYPSTQVADGILLSRVSETASMTFAWPSWVQNEKMIYNWKVRISKNLFSTIDI